MINVLDHQAQFIQSNHRHTGLVGGFRSGKSHAGLLKTIVKKLSMPSVDVAYYLPTYALVKDIAFKGFSELLTESNIPFELNITDKNFITPYGRIIMRSIERPEMIIGYEVGYSLVDEIDRVSLDKAKDAMINILARNSARYKGNNNATDFVSTPEGYKFLYHFFEKDNKNKDKLLIRANTENNPFISKSYVESLKAAYDENQLNAYLRGEFVNLTSGNVYNSYNRKLHHTDREIKETDILHIGMDFNITNMSAVIGVVDKGVLHIVAEIEKIYDTDEMARVIKQRYPKNNKVVYPDASGKNRKSNGKSDLLILKANGFKIRTMKQNPFVKDRTNEVNKKFRDGTLLVNTNTCISTTEALEQIGYKGGEPDKTSGLDHLTDAFGYLVWWQRKSTFSIR